jgi:hypothetical protein
MDSAWTSLARNNPTSNSYLLVNNAANHHRHQSLKAMNGSVVTAAMTDTTTTSNHHHQQPLSATRRAEIQPQHNSLDSNKGKTDAAMADSKTPRDRANSSGSIRLMAFDDEAIMAAKHKHIIDNLRSESKIRTDRVYEVMLAVKFSNFNWSYSYSDASYIANELENSANRIKEGDHVLVINSWYYLYVPLCLALMVGPKGQVVAHGDEGIDFVKKEHSHILESKRLVLVNFNWDTFREEGFTMKAPYDVILICEKNVTDEIKEQMRSPNGICFDQVNNKVICSANGDEQPPAQQG